MRNVARNVWQIDEPFRHAINCYLVEDVLIDAGTRFARRRLLKQLDGVALKGVALTHAHPDHQGAARPLCDAYGASLMCHAADRDAMEGRAAMMPSTLPIRMSSRVLSGPPYKVDRLLREGDEIAGFRVIETPGHTPGHVAFFRAGDGVAIVGDTMTNMNVFTTVPGLHEPPTFFTHDPAHNRASIRKIHALRPSLLLFGHGPPLRDLGRFDDFVARLPP